MLDAYRTRPPFNTWREDIVRLYAEEGTSLLDGGRAELKCPPEYEARFYEAVSVLDPWPYLERIDCPTLVAWAENGRPAPMFDRDAVGEAIEGARTVVMSGVGHFAPMERPEQVAKVIGEFLMSP
jgi:pimeloyl-ACP methyl ester carboxylesterase